MKHLNNLFCIFTISFFAFFSCSNSTSNAMEDAFMMANIPIEEEENPANSVIDEVYEVVKKENSASGNNVVKFIPSPTIPTFISTSAASTANDDGIHKFIRTAQTKFKVGNVVSATQAVEDIILKNKGFILKSTITNAPPIVKPLTSQKTLQ